MSTSDTLNTCHCDSGINPDSGYDGPGYLPGVIARGGAEDTLCQHCRDGYTLLSFCTLLDADCPECAGMGSVWDSSTMVARGYCDCRSGIALASHHIACHDTGESCPICAHFGPAAIHPPLLPDAVVARYFPSRKVG